MKIIFKCLKIIINFVKKQLVSVDLSNRNMFYLLKKKLIKIKSVNYKFVFIKRIFFVFFKEIYI